jgi:hypothetical protein
MARHGDGPGAATRANRSCPAVTTRGGQQFAVTVFRSWTRNGRLRQTSRSCVGAGNVAAMVSFVTGTEITPIREQHARRQARRSGQMARPLPDGATRYRNTRLVMRAARASAAVAGSTGALVVSVALAAAPGNARSYTPLVAGAFAGVVGALLAGTPFWLTERELATGPDFVAWRRWWTGRWRVVPHEQISRVDVVGRFPARLPWYVGRRGFVIRTADGRAIRIRNIALAADGAALRDRLAKLAGDTLAPVTTPRARDVLESTVTWSKLDEARIGTWAVHGRIAVPYEPVEGCRFPIWRPARFHLIDTHYHVPPSGLTAKGGAMSRRRYGPASGVSAPPVGPLPMPVDDPGQAAFPLPLATSLPARPPTRQECTDAPPPGSATGAPRVTTRRGQGGERWAMRPMAREDIRCRPDQARGRVPAWTCR